MKRHYWAIGRVLFIAVIYWIADLIGLMPFFPGYERIFHRLHIQTAQTCAGFIFAAYGAWAVSAGSLLILLVFLGYPVKWYWISLVIGFSVSIDWLAISSFTYQQSQCVAYEQLCAIISPIVFIILGYLAIYGRKVLLLHLRRGRA
jgi:hypothetical protein